MLFFLVFLLWLVVFMIDGNLSSIVLSTFMYFIGLVIVTLKCRSNYKIYARLFHIVYLVYLTVALIVSQSFSVFDNFFVSDSSRYIETYMKSSTFYFDKQDFINCYIEFSDSNVLYNAYLNIIAVIANTNFVDLSVYGMTLLQTFWGILSAIVLFKILSRHVNLKLAFTYTLLFVFCSYYLFYSTVIIRDILICFLYLLAFNIIDQKFSIAGLCKLILILFVTWGIRLYSGLFLSVFIAYYLYIKLRNGRFKCIAAVLFVIVLIVFGLSLLSSAIVEQTFTELNEYSELSAERSAGGLVSKLQSLPPVISHFAIVLFTMIRPIPPLSVFNECHTFSHIIISTLFLISGFFWFVVFYSYFIKLFIKKRIYSFSFGESFLLLICLAFLLANASHPDVRRMLPVFPIIYAQYIKICSIEKVSLFEGRVPISLIGIYLTMAFGFLILM